jgi:hypothetical protein
MQKLYSSLFALLLASAAFGQLNEISGGYQLSLPQASMKNGWSSGHGINLAYYRHFAHIEGFSVGMDVGLGNYAMKNEPQRYVFRDGSVTHTTATLSSSLVYGALSARYSPITHKGFSPFVELQGGFFGMHSSIYIADPTDPLGCRALENRNILSSGTSFWSPGAGFKVQLGKPTKNEIHSLEFKARFIRGGNMEYANMNRLYHNHDQTAEPFDPNKGESPLKVTFVNVTTNERHEHTVAELYEHPLRALQFNFTYSFRFNKLF